MPFQYDPKLAFSCFPPGRYAATLIQVSEGLSKKGLPLLTLTFEARWGTRSRRIRGWVANPSSLFMLKELAYALGFGAEFEAGTFDAEQCIGSEIKVELAVTSTDGWGEQNLIVHYHPADARSNEARSNRQLQPSKSTPGSRADDADDEPPF
jgi:hypothetical protein